MLGGGSLGCLKKGKSQLCKTGLDNRGKKCDEADFSSNYVRETEHTNERAKEVLKSFQRLVDHN